MTQLRKVADGLRRALCPQPAALLEEAAEDILAYRHFPVEHQRQLHSTNPLERLNKEIKRRSNVVGHLSQRRGRHPPGRGHPARAGRRMGGGRAPLLQRGVDEAAARRRPCRRERRRRSLWRSRSEGDRCGRCGNPLCWFSKQRWTGALSVHGCGSVHADVATNSGRTRGDFHHLTGHYPTVGTLSQVFRVCDPNWLGDDGSIRRVSASTPSSSVEH